MEKGKWKKGNGERELEKGKWRKGNGKRERLTTLSDIISGGTSNDTPFWNSGAFLSALGSYYIIINEPISSPLSLYHAVLLSDQEKITL